MNVGKGMNCEIMISNGTHTVGYVNGKPVEWVGNYAPYTEGVAFWPIKDDGSGSTIIFNKQNP